MIQATSAGLSALASSMLIVVKQGRVLEFDPGDFQRIEDESKQRSLLFSHNRVFHDDAFNQQLARDALLGGDFASYVQRMEDGFACVSLEQGIPNWLLTDQFGGRRLYFYRSHDLQVISDDPMRLLQWLDDDGISPDLDDEQLGHFARIGYADEGKTYLKNLGRSVPGLQTRFDGQAAEDLLRYMTPLESSFGSVLESTMHRATRAADGIVLLFSGGMDSTALLLACLEAAPDRDILCVTATPEPKTLVDVRIKAQIETSARIAKRLGVRHEYVKMNFVNKDEQALFAQAQPFDFGTANWLPAFRSVPDTSNHLFVCGQNADSLSNFGHTAPFMGTGRAHKFSMMGKRVLVTRQLLGFRHKALLFPLLEKLFVRSGKYQLARNDREVFDYFFRPEMYRLPLAGKGTPRLPEGPLGVGDGELIDELFFRNLRRYNDSSVARLFQSAAAMSGQAALLPYSSRDIIRFYQHRLHAASTLEQLQGKYQIRKYVTRRIPRSVINAGYAIEEKSSRRKIRIKNEIRVDALQVWASILPEPLNRRVGERLAEFESSAAKPPKP